MFFLYAASFPTSTLLPPPIPIMQYALDEAFITRSTLRMSEASTLTHFTGTPNDFVTTPLSFSLTFAPEAITTELFPEGNSTKSPSSPRIPSPIRIRRGNSIVWEPSGIVLHGGDPGDKSFPAGMCAPYRVAHPGRREQAWTKPARLRRPFHGNRGGAITQKSLFEESTRSMRPKRLGRGCRLDYEQKMAKRADTKMPEPREVARSIRKEYESRTDDVSDALDGLRKEFGRRADDVRGAAEDLEQQYDKKADQVRARVSESVDDGRHAVRKHPFLAVGVTLGVGFVAGVLLGRKSKA